jgi:hypothetical protein
MTFASAPGTFKKFKRTTWRFQQTFRTPLKDLDRFVETILDTARIEHCTITIDEVVFDPKNVWAALPYANIVLNHDFSIEADGEEVKKLLVAAFSDWIDFLFVPVPKPFIIYADHDEYATFYANSKSSLNQVVMPLREAGFKAVDDWIRSF